MCGTLLHAWSHWGVVPHGQPKCDLPPFHADKINTRPVCILYFAVPDIGIGAAETTRFRNTEFRILLYLRQYEWE